MLDNIAAELGTKLKYILNSHFVLTGEFRGTHITQYLTKPRKQNVLCTLGRGFLRMGVADEAGLI